MSQLKELLRKKIAEHRPRITHLLEKHAHVKVDEITIGQIYGGMRGVKCLVSDISCLDPEKGIRYRGYTLPEVFEKLPKPPKGDMPYVEGLFFLLLTGEIPTEEQVIDVINDLSNRRILPRYVYEVIDAYPSYSHPMAIFSSAIMTMQRESFFNKKYRSGVSKMDYWESTYEDALNLLAKLPEVASYIYAKVYRKGTRIHSSPHLDFGANFANMMGIDTPYDDVSRMYFIVHADHEGGNVSAHTGHLVASSLADVYLAISGMVNGLAGPLHGLANQEVLRWLQALKEKMGDVLPTEDELKQFVWDTLNSGQVIPGFGHAVLRKTDPRYMVQREFCQKHMPEDELFKYTDMLYKIVPDILIEHGKAKNPWPNLDAQSGVIQWHYGVKEFDFYTVLFGIGRAIGVLSNVIWDRAIGYPLERPKSVTTDMLTAIAHAHKKK